jgi:ribonucleoside-triphosphate reductase
MEIVTVSQPIEFRLREDFLAPYRQKGDPFTSLLARSTYLTKYCREGETWTDTVRRVVEGNLSLVMGSSNTEAELLFHLFWTGQSLPPGRGLWVGGVPGIPSDARYNCWYTTLYGIDDWCWIANQLMLGGGVGVGLLEIDKMPVVLKSNARLVLRCASSHPNRDEVKPDDNDPLNGSTQVFVIPDSREGWVEGIGMMLEHAFNGVDLIMDVSKIRPRGQPLKTFGGIACGPGPLAHLLRSAWKIIRGGQGRKLTSVEVLDVTNHIGLCIKSGNVRRSAMITLGSAYDQAFRDAKKDWEAVASHRHTSNNSIAFQSWKEIEDFDWRSLVEDNSVYGEPGILNLPLGWQTDPGAKGVNPCGEQLLHDREACNLGEVFPAKFEKDLDPVVAFRLVTRYCLRQRMTPLLDSQSQAVGTQNMRIGVGLGGICDFDWTPEMLANWFMVCRKEADSYADELGVNRPTTVTTVKPSGTVSLLNGSSPGMHAPEAPYYLRRTRIAKNDPMSYAMMEAGVPFEEDVYDKSGNTWVFSFPMKAPHTTFTRSTETLLEQFERQAAVQEWWSDNAVSATLNFNADTEREELASCLKEFVPRLKSTSCMPRAHGYEQPPYEPIDEITYRRMAGYINNEHPLVGGGEIEVADSCSSGACPIR